MHRVSLSRRWALLAHQVQSHSHIHSPDVSASPAAGLALRARATAVQVTRAQTLPSQDI